MLIVRMGRMGCCAAVRREVVSVHGGMMLLDVYLCYVSVGWPRMYGRFWSR